VFYPSATGGELQLHMQFMNRSLVRFSQYYFNAQICRKMSGNLVKEFVLSLMSFMVPELILV